MSIRIAKLGLIFGALVVCGSIVAMAARPQVYPATPKPKIHWRSNLEMAHAEAVKSKKPILVVFGADWCTFCKKMDETAFVDPTLVTYVNNNFVPVQLDLDKNQRTAAILDVDRIPATVALTPNADLLGRVIGYVNVDTYRESLSKVRALHQRVEAEKPVVANRVR